MIGCLSSGEYINWAPGAPGRIPPDGIATDRAAAVLYLRGVRAHGLIEAQAVSRAHAGRSGRAGGRTPGPWRARPRWPGSCRRRGAACRPSPSASPRGETRRIQPRGRPPPAPRRGPYPGPPGAAHGQGLASRASPDPAAGGRGRTGRLALGSLHQPEPMRGPVAPAAGVHAAVLRHCESVSRRAVNWTRRKNRRTDGRTTRGGQIIPPGALSCTPASFLCGSGLPASPSPSFLVSVECEPVTVSCRQTGRTAASVGIENGAPGKHEHPHQPTHQRQGLLRRMSPSLSPGRRRAVAVEVLACRSGGFRPLVDVGPPGAQPLAPRGPGAPREARSMLVQRFAGSRGKLSVTAADPSCATVVGQRPRSAPSIRDPPAFDVEVKGAMASGGQEDGIVRCPEPLRSGGAACAEEPDRHVGDRPAPILDRGREPMVVPPAGEDGQGSAGATMALAADHTAGAGSVASHSVPPA